jgi:hypothetical protein
MNSLRLILWTISMAYSGFLIAGRGSRSFDKSTISEAVIGAVLGFLLAFLFKLRARRRQPAYAVDISRLWQLLDPPPLKPRFPWSES